MTRIVAALYTATFVAGTVTSLRRGLIAEPLGIRTPLTPSMHALAGGGGALAAPWPLIWVLWRSMRRAANEGPDGRGARRHLVLLAALFLAGAASEPVSHRPLSRKPPNDVAVEAILNIFLPAVMLVASPKAMNEGLTAADEGTSRQA